MKIILFLPSFENCRRRCGADWGMWEPGALFSGVCVDKPANQQCDYLCRKGEKLLSGSCKNKKCVCVCWISRLYDVLYR